MRRTALVVGVSSPPSQDLLGHVYDFAELRGAPTDARAVAKLLKSIGIEVDLRTGPGSTTREQVLNSLSGHIAAMSQNDLFVFFFSGHGWRIPDDSGDEIRDQSDEVLLMSDGAIRDDAFPELWKTLPAGSRVVTLIDACHSASVTFGILPTQAPPVAPLLPKRIPSGPSVLSWSACLEEEQAFQIGRNGSLSGVFSESLLAAWSEPANRASYDVLWTAISNEVQAYNLTPRQTPDMQFVGPNTDMIYDRPFGVVDDPG